MAEWHGILGGHVPFAPVLTVAEALRNPFVAETALRDVVTHPDRPDGLHMLASPIRINRSRRPGRRAPKLGEHTAEISGGQAAPA